MTNNEVNRVIAELSNHYDILRTGEIFRRSDGKHIRGCILKQGYVQVCLMGKKYYVHRLIAMKYVSNRYGFRVVNHRDGDGLNNSFYNLEWCSQKYNVHHYHSNFKVYKLAKDKIELIKDIYNNNAMSQRQLAKTFDTSQGYISQIVNNKRRFEKDGKHE